MGVMRIAQRRYRLPSLGSVTEAGHLTASELDVELIVHWLQVSKCSGCVSRTNWNDTSEHLLELDHTQNGSISILWMNAGSLRCRTQKPGLKKYQKNVDPYIIMQQEDLLWSVVLLCEDECWCSRGSCQNPTHTGHSSKSSISSQVTWLLYFSELQQEMRW